MLETAALFAGRFDLSGGRPRSNRCSGLVRGMHIVDPSDLFRRLARRDVEVYYDRFLSASHEHAFERLIGAGVDFLMRNKRRDVDEVADAGFSGELQPITPTHASLALDDIDHAFKLAVMMRPRFRVGMNAYSAGPELRSARSSMSDRRRPIHSRSLRRVSVEFAGVNDTNPVKFPIDFFLRHIVIFIET